MKSAVTVSYTFTPASKTVDLSGISGFDIKRLYGIVNVTANQLIYATGQPAYGFVSEASGVVTLVYNTTSMNAADQLLIIYDQDGVGDRSDTAASSDTGTFSLIALFKRFIQRVPTLGQKTKSGGTPVTFASDQVGAAGTAAADVLSIQGIAGMTPVAISGSITAQPAANTTSTGTLTALNSTVTLAAGTGEAIGVQLLGTWVGTVTFEGSVDGSTWYAVHAVPVSGGLETQTATANGTWQLPGGGLQSFRVRMSAYTSGTANVTLLSSVGGRVYRVFNTNPYNMKVAARIQDGQGRDLMASPFNLLGVATERPKIQVMFPYYIDTTDDVTTTVTGTGSVTQSNGIAVVSSGATASSTAIMRTRRFISYRPGQGVIARMSGFTTSTPPSTAKVIQGPISAEDGFAFAWNGTTPSILHRRNSSDTYVDRTNWNVDKVDGTGLSGFTWNPLFGSPLTIAYQWLGVGTAWFFVYDEDKPILVHKIVWGNANTGVSLLNPSLPMSVEVSNGGTASAVAINVPCLMASSWGEDSPVNLHLFAGGASNVSLGNGTETFVAALFSKTTFQSKTNRMITQPQNISLSCVGQRTRFRIYRRDASTGLTGTSFADVDATNSCMQVSTAGTFTSTGWREVKSFILEAGGNTVVSLEADEFPILPGEYWVITALANGASAFGGAIVNWGEER